MRRVAVGSLVIAAHSGWNIVYGVVDTCDDH
jgi:hypothetical protein